MPMLIFAKEQGEDAALALPGPHGMWFRSLSFNRKEGFYFHTNQGRGLKNRTHSRWERVLLRSSLPDAGCPPPAPAQGQGLPSPWSVRPPRALLSSRPLAWGQCLSRACAGSAGTQSPRSRAAWSCSFLGHSRGHCSLLLQPWS